MRHDLVGHVYILSVLVFFSRIAIDGRGIVGKRRVNRATSLPRDTDVCGQCQLVAARAKVTAGKKRCDLRGGVCSPGGKKEVNKRREGPFLEWAIREQGGMGVRFGTCHRDLVKKWTEGREKDGCRQSQAKPYMLHSGSEKFPLDCHHDGVTVQHCEAGYHLKPRQAKRSPF